MTISDGRSPRLPSSREGLRSAWVDTVQTALGRTHRDDPAIPGSGGPAGNARLTAWTGIALLALSIAELVTLLNIGALISWHIVVGTLLMPPALLKTATTGWRIVRYYGGNASYHRAGPPPLPLRVLGPGVVVGTLALLASGLVLVLLGQTRSRTVLFTALGFRVDWITVHQGLFAVWAVFTGLHVLGRAVPALRLTVLHDDAAGPVDGTTRRAAIMAGVAAVAAVGAVLVLSTSGSWRHGIHHRPFHGHGLGVQAPAVIRPRG